MLVSHRRTTFTILTARAMYFDCVIGSNSFLLNRTISKILNWSLGQIILIWFCACIILFRPPKYKNRWRPWYLESYSFFFWFYPILNSDNWIVNQLITSKWFSKCVRFSRVRKLKTAKLIVLLLNKKIMSFQIHLKVFWKSTYS